jgi:hypothetical protein
VHYQKGLTGYKGTIGSDRFYLSPCGRKNPLKELDATIALFQSNDFQTQCFFPARYSFLKKHHLTNAPFPSCPDLEQFRDDLRPAGITLLFTDAYMNNSSSLFGHTLLRIDTGRKGTQLLAHGINYGAYTGGYENSFLYAVYGLTGAYPGGFTVKPYYDIVNTYNNMENRDIWEYGLNLSKEELALFVDHIWEVGQTQTPYYFFSQNCSYMLMEIFDAVRPSLRLAERFSAQTIPVDTVKAVWESGGLVSSVGYRPSRRRKIRYRMSLMSPVQYETFLSLRKNPEADLSALNEEERADVLETAYQEVQYRYVAGTLDLKDYRTLSFKLLRRRSQTHGSQKFDDLKEGENPVFSHDSKRMYLAGGFQKGRAFNEISYRPAYHSATDNGYGYLRGAEINFADFVFRYYNSKNRFVLQRFNLLELASFSPIDRVFQAPSYKVDVRLTRDEPLKEAKAEAEILRIGVAGGATVEPVKALQVYALTSVEGAYGGTLDNNGWLGVGVTGGMQWQTSQLGFQAQVKQIFAASRVGTQTIASVLADYYLNRQWTLEGRLTHRENDFVSNNETLFGLKYYF